jgi:serine/threonine protein phosphatase 1
MVLSLFRRKSGDPRVEAPGRIPDGMSIYAIGDVHGRADLLKQLLEQIEADYRRRSPRDVRIIQLGDLIDRGPDSADVVELCIAHDWGMATPTFIAGNHEEMMLAALNGDLEAARLWKRNGGEATLLSYGVPASLVHHGTADSIIADLAERVPPAHVRFFRDMKDYVVLGDFWFVHAGVKPRIALEQQNPAHLRWIRGEFLDYGGHHPATVVHGHTISADVDERPNRIGIDTGAYETGRLTAIGLSASERWYLTT